MTTKWWTIKCNHFCNMYQIFLVDVHFKSYNVELYLIERNCIWILSYFNIWFESSINDWVGDICLSKFTRCNISKVLLCFSAYHELLFAEKKSYLNYSLQAFVVVSFYFPKYNNYNTLFYSPWFFYCLNHKFEYF